MRFLLFRRSWEQFTVLFKSDTLGFGIIGFMLAAMGFVGSLVFIMLLPEIAAPEDRDRISARGFSFGYIGSVIMQMVGFCFSSIYVGSGLATRITFHWLESGGLALPK